MVSSLRRLIFVTTWGRKNKRLALGGEAKHQYDYATRLRYAGDRNEALHWYVKAAEQGYVPAMFCAGVMYGRVEDHEQARRWMIAASEAGDKHAAYAAAVECVRAGDEPAARHHLARAIELKHPTARHFTTERIMRALVAQKKRQRRKSQAGH